MSHLALMKSMCVSESLSHSMLIAAACVAGQDHCSIFIPPTFCWLFGRQKNDERCCERDTETPSLRHMLELQMKANIEK